MIRTHLKPASRRIHLRSYSVSTGTLKYALLPSRALIRVDAASADTDSLLHGLVTADIKGLHQRPYTAFLNAPGRVLNDVFIYTSEDGPCHIEVDKNQSGALIKHLQKHRLRRRMKFELEDAQVHAVWSDSQASLRSDLEPLHSWRLDQRPGMGARCILQSPQRMEELFGPPSTFQEYTAHRMLNGVAEGDEIVPESALPLESNIDLFGGIDFRKGCYLGQELTIRTHHTGIVRKRIVPVQLYTDSKPDSLVYSSTQTFDPAVGSSLQRTAEPQKSSRTRNAVGKWLGGVGNIGLALCRLERVSDIRLTEDDVAFDPNEEFTIQQGDGTSSIKAKPFIPTWMREAITTHIASRKPERRT